MGYVIASKYGSFKWNPAQNNIFIFICLIAGLIPIGFITDFFIRALKVSSPKKFQENTSMLWF